MAGVRGGLTKRRRMIANNCNRLLSGVASGRWKRGTLVADIAKRMNLSQDGTYHSLKRLYILKRLKRENVDGTLWWKVLNSNPVTFEEVADMGDPYKVGKKPKRTGGRKKGSKNKPKLPVKTNEPEPQLDNPMVIYNHPSDERVRVMIDGSPEGCAAFLKQIGRN